MRFFVLILSIVVLAFSANAQLESYASSASGRTTWDAVPNVVLVIADDVNNVGLDAVVTPNIDALASAGVRFSNFYAANNCIPSRSLLLTGLYGIHTGIQQVAGPEASSKHFFGLGRALWYNSTNRHSLAIFGKGADMPVDGQYDPSQIYEQYLYNYPSNLDNAGMGYRSWDDYLVNSPDSEIRHTIDYGVTRKTTYADEEMTTQFEAWRDALPSGQPWIAWLGYHLVHRPIHDPYDANDNGHDCPGSETSAQCWDAMLKKLDDQVGLIVSYLTTNGLLNNTVVIFIGDNGNDVEHGGGKGQVTEAGINCPLIVAHGGITASGTLTDLISEVDIPETILDYANARSHPATMDNVVGDSRFNGQAWFSDGTSFRCILNPSSGCVYWPNAKRTFNYYTGKTTRDSVIRDEAGYKLHVSNVDESKKLYSLPDESTDLCAGDGTCAALTGADATAFAALDTEFARVEQNPPPAP